MWDISIAGLILTYRSSGGNCAHLCRYCSIGKMDGKAPEFGRYAKLVTRLYDWAKANRSNYSVGTALIDRNDEPNLDDEKAELCIRLGGATATTVTTGGLKRRNPDQISELLNYWKGRGIEVIHSSFGGLKETHDYYNRRVGDFEQLIEFQKQAANIEMEIGQSIFVTTKTWRSLDSMEDILNKFGRPKHRHIYPIGYVGLARDLEDQRIDEDIRDVLISKRQNSLLRPSSWLSEREWIGRLRDGVWIGRTPLVFDINVENIDSLELMSDEMIVCNIESKGRNAFMKLPDLDCLINEVADPSGRKVYTSVNDVLAMWIDRLFSQKTTRPDLGWGDFIDLRV
jgi:hypothetical protein